jgi:hypothetical protein
VPVVATAAEPANLRPDRVRAFVVENTGSVLLREGREAVRRVVLDGACSALAGAARVDFQIGGVLLSTEETGREVPVVLKNAPQVVSTGTPHLHLVTAHGVERTACPVGRIENASPAEFESAQARGDVRDQRRDAAGR